MRTLEITSYIGCPNRCGYCCQDVLLENYEGKQSMDVQDFINILRNVPKDVRIDFSGFSEIFFHPSGSAMIRNAYEQGYQVVLYTTLEGLREVDIDTLKGVKFAEVVFHKWPGLDKNIWYERKDIFQREVQHGRIAEMTPQWLWSRGGNLFHVPVKMGGLHCLYANKDFDHNVVLPNGDVVLCCQDYGLKHKLGNLLKTNFNDMKRERIARLSSARDSILLCRTCELAQYDTDNSRSV